MKPMPSYLFQPLYSKLTDSVTVNPFHKSLTIYCLYHIWSKNIKISSVRICCFSLNWIYLCVVVLVRQSKLRSWILGYSNSVFLHFWHFISKWLIDLSRKVIYIMMKIIISHCPVFNDLSINSSSSGWSPLFSDVFSLSPSLWILTVFHFVPSLILCFWLALISVWPFFFLV